jgi:hypothetical protein
MRRLISHASGMVGIRHIGGGVASSSVRGAHLPLYWRSLHMSSSSSLSSHQMRSALSTTRSSSISSISSTSSPSSTCLPSNLFSQSWPSTTPSVHRSFSTKKGMKMHTMYALASVDHLMFQQKMEVIIKKLPQKKTPMNGTSKVIRQPLIYFVHQLVCQFHSIHQPTFINCHICCYRISRTP